MIEINCCTLNYFTKMLQFAWLNTYEYSNNYYNITITEKFFLLTFVMKVLNVHFGLHSGIFSCFKSQWIILRLGVARNSNAVQSCCANFPVRLSDTLQKLQISCTYKNSINVYIHGMLLGSFQYLAIECKMNYHQKRIVWHRKWCTFYMNEF